MKPANRTPSRPLERYLSVLEAVAASPDGASLSELASRCGLPAGTTHRVLAKLLEADLIEPARGGTKEYVLGRRLLRLAYAGSTSGWVRIIAQPVLDRLANEIGETCFITRLIGTRIISVALAVPSDGISNYVVPGNVMPPHASASAKAILAFQPDAVVDQILKPPLKRLAPRTKVDPEAVKGELRTVRARGQAACVEEIETGIVAFACPISVPGVGVFYSVGTSGLLERFSRMSQADVAAALRRAAAELSRSLQGGLVAAHTRSQQVIAAD